MATTSKAAEAWSALNERQQLWLRTIYEADQDAEEFHRGAYARGTKPVPPGVWRWLEYEHTATRRQRGVVRGRGLLQAKLDELDIRDEGAGSTIKVLAGKQLIEVRYEDDDPRNNRMALQLTRLGRAAARAGGCDDARPGRRNKRRPLSEALWRMLAEVYRAGDNGLQPRGMSLHPAGDKLIERDFVTVEFGTRNTLRLAEPGRAHYREEWPAYARMYPGVPAPHPDGEPVWPQEVDRRLWTLRDTCRALDAEHRQTTDELTRDVREPRPIVKDRGPEFQRLTTQRNRRDKLAVRARELLVEHHAELDSLIRAATARFLAVAAAVVTAVAEGSDPALALDAEPLVLDTVGQLPHPVTGVPGVDLDISKARPGGMRRRKRSTAPAPDDPVTTRQARDYADFLAELAMGGRLARLLLRHEPDNGD